jgi:hypothetical protein
MSSKILYEKNGAAAVIILEPSGTFTLLNEELMTSTGMFGVEFPYMMLLFDAAA